MAATERPQLYLITPPEIDLEVFPDLLGRMLDSTPVACLRLSLATRDEDRLGRAADALREVAHARDVAIVIEQHLLLAGRHGLDGVHLTDGARTVAHARKELEKTLGKEAIVGAFCGTSRHDGLTAGERGADYVSFGPVSGGLGDGSTAPKDLFDWWSEMIEISVVAEGGLNEEMLASLSESTDFFGIGDEIWSTEDPVATLKALNATF